MSGVWHRLMENGSYAEHQRALDVVRKRMAAVVGDIGRRMDMGVDEEGKIVYEDRVLLPFEPIVHGIVYWAAEEQLPLFQDTARLPLVVDVVKVVELVQSCGEHRLWARPDFLAAVQWLALMWLVLDDELRRHWMPEGWQEEWWQVARATVKAWRKGDATLDWPATPLTPPLELVPHRCGSKRLLGLLRSLYWLWCR